jgi:alkanesulfonate monooxygenase SsuD/methylene tetrahydromethanopterin reductase-like flavin-dependent oxidoreductase (luciferase family)
MKLAIETRYQDKKLELPLERIKLVERLGYDAVFVPEGHGTDCFTVMGFVAAHTQRITIGTRIMQITARSPANAAMGFQSIAQLAGQGRVIAGIGASMRQTCEGWHGKPWGSPYHKMRDYVAIMRGAANSEEMLDYEGKEYSAPYRGPDAMPATPMRSYLDCDPTIPIISAASGPVMIKLHAEISDGWFPSSFWPGDMANVRPMLEEGFAKSGNPRKAETFEIWNHVDVMMGDDVRAAMYPAKVYSARWAEMNQTTMAARGFGDVCQRIIELQKAGHTEEAIEAVPDEYIDAGWLVGSLDRVAERFKSVWRDSGATGTIIRHGDQFAKAAPAENLEIYSAIAKAAGL